MDAWSFSKDEKSNTGACTKNLKTYKKLINVDAKDEETVKNRNHLK